MMSMPDLSTRRSPTVVAPLSEVFERLAETIRPLVETVAVSESVGATCVEDVVATEDVPASDRAVRGGYACASSDLVGISAQNPGFPNVLPASVVPGSLLPAGTDCVLPSDAIGTFVGMPAVFDQAGPGEGVRRRGEDIRRGAVLLRAGSRIGARQAAGLAACGIRTIRAAWLPVGMPEIEAPAAKLLRILLTANGMRMVGFATGGLDITFKPGGSDGIALTGCLEMNGSGRTLIVPEEAPVLLPLVYALIAPLADKVCASEVAPRRLPLSAHIASVVGMAELVLLRERDGRFEPSGIGEVPYSALLRATHRAVLPPESEGLPSGTEIEAFPL
jgi:molybdopterin molybdotransferase